MNSRRWVVLALLLTGFVAKAEDDDLLTPLPPSKKAVKAPKPKVKPRPKEPVKDPEELLAPLAPSTRSLLTVRVPPSMKGARLFVDDREVGTLPLTPLDVAPGEHVVAVRRSGYSDFSRRVSVLAGKAAEVVATLEPVAGFASVTCEVAGAQVIVDGQPVGPVPLSELLLAPGGHEIAIRREGYEQDVQMLSVRAGGSYAIIGRLKPSTGESLADRPTLHELTPSSAGRDSSATELRGGVSQPIYSRWYFWAGAAAAGTVAAVVSVVAVNAAQPKPLTLEQAYCGGGPCSGCIGDSCPAH